MGGQQGKFAGGVGRDFFRRPLRKDAREGAPDYLKRFTRHDFYWGFGKLPMIVVGGYFLSNAYWERYSNAAIDYKTNKEFFDRNRRLAQITGDDRPLLDRPFALEKAIKKAQVRAFLAGDPVYEEAFHRIYLDRAWWKTFWYLNQINPEDNEFLPIPYHHRPSDGKFTFHDEKLNYRNKSISERGRHDMTNEERAEFMKKYNYDSGDLRPHSGDVPAFQKLIRHNMGADI
ncbi:unnamed protein product [Oikopleura dioica]|uniref:Uncharacterized protein n=1 Tax=Oikopleura dioica TaxID=34765 RepID=E4XES1_OIKDI|nr:unnamed protein product [Oikopleura dioica]CBY35206.1 unnamed protein product [Oikopleura dioica]